MASFRYHVHADFVYVDAPFAAAGPPQEVIAQFYPNLPYFEWQAKTPDYSSNGQSKTIDEGLNWLLEYLMNEENGVFDGILGFSQVCVCVCVCECVSE
jgi:hypothetical protein